MGFPIKKRMSPPTSPSLGDTTQSPVPSGLDLLSAVISSSSSSRTAAAATAQQHYVPATAIMPTAPARRMDSEGTIVTHSSTAAASEAEDSSSSQASSEEVSTPKQEDVAKAMSSTFNSDQKRAKTFPEILMDILSDPSYTSIVGWLPHGKSFAIHSPTQFQTVILPKYFRKVIFRSFIRKLNRWGFRSVKRSVSGFEHTFEAQYFCRDERELCVRMCCKSNPTSRAAAASASAKRINSVESQLSASSEAAAAANTSTSTVTPNSSANALSVMTEALSSLRNSPSSSRQQVHAAAPLRPGQLRNEEFELQQLRNELMIREIQRQRQDALLQMIHQMPPSSNRNSPLSSSSNNNTISSGDSMSEADRVSQYVAERWQRIMMAQQQHQQQQEYHSNGRLPGY